MLIQSGRPKNCIGVYPGDIPSDINYGASYFYCKGQPTPRGSQGRLPWTYRLDLGVQYAPAFAKNNLTFSATVVNVFDKQTVQSINESGETGSGAPNLSYRQPLSYQTPRYVQFGARYDFSL